ncbi:MAG: peptide chain release factor N(5)-glutamine methyltransferase [Actinomycetota bacterium]|nr:peptide chain release factor N(5)-glutamine methyltransferase [Actinomycetota bacterium]
MTPAGAPSSTRPPTGSAAGVTWRSLLDRARATTASAPAARWLVEEIAGLSASGLVAALDAPAPQPAIEQMDRALGRLADGEPLQHVLGRWGFYGLTLRCDARALIPRPETELLVELALAELDGRDPRARRALDLGTGSLAIAAALVVADEMVEVVAVDRSARALELAAENRELLAPAQRRRLELREGSWYGALFPAELGSYTLIAANPPYLAADEWAGLDPVVRDHDPYDALVAGPSGLEALTAVIAGAPDALGRPGALLVELAPAQAEDAERLARAAGAVEAAILADLAGRPRVLRARW